jgi:hypothetical protein
VKPDADRGSRNRANGGHSILEWWFGAFPELSTNKYFGVVCIHNDEFELQAAIHRVETRSF